VREVSPRDKNSSRGLVVCVMAESAGKRKKATVEIAPLEKSSKRKESLVNLAPPLEKNKKPKERNKWKSRRLRIIHQLLSKKTAWPCML
jgi:hypothetical protein